MPAIPESTKISLSQRPTTGQQAGSGWNATWTQTGGAVRVTSPDTNGHLAVGATTSTGMVASYSGPNAQG